jgi:NTP pyrophosphatase (non-canonical NTP hydrolase)
MNMNEYQELASRTGNIEDSKTRVLCNYALGLNGEAGEVADILKKHIFHGHPLDREEFAKELGDCLWYVSQLARLAGYTLEEIAVMNIEKLKKRYPNGFKTSDSIHRVV